MYFSYRREYLSCTAHMFSIFRFVNNNNNKGLTNKQRHAKLTAKQMPTTVTTVLQQIAHSRLLYGGSSTEFRISQ